MEHINRRDFLKLSGSFALGLLGRNYLPVDKWNQSQSSAGAYIPDAEINITAAVKQVQILPGAATTVWGYEGHLVNGTGAVVQSIPGSYLGPLLRVRSGTKLRINFINKLPERSVLHPHGLRVPEDCDGTPMQSINTGQTKVYDFQMIDRAGPYWFHPHPMNRTAEQVVMGLAGLMNVWDPEEEAAVPGASTGANDVHLVIQDRLFDTNNQLLYLPNMMFGYLGDRILVNGAVNASFELEPRGYRLRLLNGSNARTYKLAWNNGAALKVIGTDGGLLAAAVTRPYVMLMPGERIDLWVDFSALSGQTITLKSLAFDPGGMGMMGMGGGMGGRGMQGMGGMGMMGSTLPQGSQLDILKVNVGMTASSSPILGTLPPLPDVLTAADVPNWSRPRVFTISMGPMMSWLINGRTYDMNDMKATALDEQFYSGGSIAWEWVNNSMLPHPMHLHNIHFQVVERTPSPLASYATINQGLVDEGLKDTVLVWPGERVKTVMKFGPHNGLYMYHCHILEHEDMGMMRNFLIS